MFKRMLCMLFVLVFAVALMPSYALAAETEAGIIPQAPDPAKIYPVTPIQTFTQETLPAIPSAAASDESIYMEKEPNDAPEDSGILNSGMTISGSVSAADEYDFYAFTLSQDQQVTLIAGSDTNTLLFAIYDETLTDPLAVFLTSEKVEGVYMAGFTVELPAGTYYVVFMDDLYGSSSYVAYFEHVALHEHQWDAGVITTEPSCISTGEKVLTCTICGVQTVETISPNSHTWDKLVFDPDIKSHIRYCSVCGAKGYAEGCTFDEGQVLQEATPDIPGIRKYTCSACGGSYVDEYAYFDPDEVIRLSGENRFLTAFKVANQMKLNLGVEKFDAIIVASGSNFADALSGSYLAAVKNAPILLSFDETYDNLAKDYINANLNPGGTVYILGGTSAVPASMESGLDGFTVTRLAGDNRFATNLAILDEAGVEGKDILVCTGISFADSLSASAAKLPILLVWQDLTEDQKAFLENVSGNLYVIGGTSAVSETLQEQVSQYGPTERLGGSNRFDTSVKIAEKFFDSPDSAVLAYAWNYPDGLCGGALAATMNAPLLLTMQGYENAAQTYASLNGLSKGAVLGGEGLIPDKSVKNIFSLPLYIPVTVK